MVPFKANILFKAVSLTVLTASFANAAPGLWPPGSASSAKYATHRSKYFKRDINLEAYHPPATYQIFEEGIEHPSGSSLTKRAGLAATATSFVASHLKIDESKVAYRSGYTAETAAVAYLQQHHDGISFANAVANLALKDNKIVAFGQSFVNASNIASSTPTIELKDAIASAENALDGKHNGFPVKLEYLAKDDGSVALTHVVQIQNNEDGTWLEAFVDAHSRELLSVTDFVAEATYNVLPIINNNLLERQQNLTNPADLFSSPKGWHWNGSATTTTTAGNNVVAYKGSESNFTSESSSDLVFNYSYDNSSAPDTTSNVDAARTHGFYLANAIHDITYRYGFTEEAFNFQNDNFGQGGAGGDRVLMSVQDSSGTNNANFATPPDGQSGVCRMYIFTLTTPKRDGSLENDIPAHELTHGVTNRMTGGGTGRCLQVLESKGLGEGWSDAFAEWTEQKDATIRDFVTGTYVLNKPAGVRSHPYSTNSTVNPLKYSNIAYSNNEHDIGEVWANILHNVYAALVNKYGWSSTAFTDPSGTEGNVAWLHLFIDALTIQPCNPTFLNARDAWIQADVNRYGGVNKCLLWKVFASKGLGVDAKSYVNDASLPADC